MREGRKLLTAAWYILLCGLSVGDGIMLVSQHIALLQIGSVITVKQIPAKPVIVVETHVKIAGCGHKAGFVIAECLLRCTQGTDIFLYGIICGFLGKAHKGQAGCTLLGTDEFDKLTFFSGLGKGPRQDTYLRGLRPSAAGNAAHLCTGHTVGHIFAQVFKGFITAETLDGEQSHVTEGVRFSAFETDCAAKSFCGHIHPTLWRGHIGAHGFVHHQEIW